MIFGISMSTGNIFQILCSCVYSHQLIPPILGISFEISHEIKGVSVVQIAVVQKEMSYNLDQSEAQRYVTSVP